MEYTKKYVDNLKKEIEQQKKSNKIMEDLSIKLFKLNNKRKDAITVLLPKINEMEIADMLSELKQLRKFKESVRTKHNLEKN